MATRYSYCVKKKFLPALLATLLSTQVLAQSFAFPKTDTETLVRMEKSLTVAHARAVANAQEVGLSARYQYVGWDKTGYLNRGHFASLRRDGAPKNTGFFGEIVLQAGPHRGKVITEASVIIDGQEIPLLNPLLLPNDIEVLRSGRINEQIIEKAKKWQQLRIAQKKSPFAEPAEIAPRDKWVYNDLQNMLVSAEHLRAMVDVAMGKPNPHSMLSPQYEQYTAEQQRQQEAREFFADNPNLTHADYRAYQKITAQTQEPSAIAQKFKTYLANESDHNISNRPLGERLWKLTDYFFTNMANNSILGNSLLGVQALGASIIKGELRPAKHYWRLYQQNQSFLDYYNLGTKINFMQETALMAGSLAVDAPVFMALGGAGGAAAKSATTGLKLSPLAARAVTPSIRMGITLGAYDGLSAIGQELGKDNNFTRSDWGNVAYQAGRGAFNGLAMGQFTRFMHMPRNARWGAAQRGAANFALGTGEGAAFSLSGNIYDAAAGHMGSVYGNKDALAQMNLQNMAKDALKFYLAVRLPGELRSRYGAPPAYGINLNPSLPAAWQPGRLQNRLVRQALRGSEPLRNNYLSANGMGYLMAMMERNDKLKNNADKINDILRSAQKTALTKYQERFGNKTPHISDAQWQQILSRTLNKKLYAATWMHKDVARKVYNTFAKGVFLENVLRIEDYTTFVANEQKYEDAIERHITTLGAPFLKQGGSYKSVRDATLGGEVHHLLPASLLKKLTKIEYNEGPSIWMLAKDHHLTSSNSKSNNMETYMDKMSSLLRQNRYRDALAFEIRDTRRRFGPKYNIGFLQAVRHAKGMPYFYKSRQGHAPAPLLPLDPFPIIKEHYGFEGQYRLPLLAKPIQGHFQLELPFPQDGVQEQLF